MSDLLAEFAFVGDFGVLAHAALPRNRGKLWCRLGL